MGKVNPLISMWLTKYCTETLIDIDFYAITRLSSFNYYIKFTNKMYLRWKKYRLIFLEKSWQNYLFCFIKSPSLPCFCTVEHFLPASESFLTSVYLLVYSGTEKVNRIRDAHKIQYAGESALLYSIDINKETELDILSLHSRRSVDDTLIQLCQFNLYILSCIQLRTSQCFEIWS